MTRESAMQFMEQQLQGEAAGAIPGSEPVPVVPVTTGNTASPVVPAAPVPLQTGVELDELVAAREATPAVDPRVAWREAQIQTIVQRGLMPEAMARAVVNGAKKPELEAWLAGAQAIGSGAPPQGQPATPALSAPGGQPRQPDVASPESRQPARAANPPDDVLALRAQMAQLEQVVLGERRAQARAEFAAAGSELAREFTRILTPTGALDSNVGATAKALLALPEFANAPAIRVLRAAAAAVFSTGPGSSDVPVTTSPRTPVADSIEGYKAPTNKYDRGAMVIEIRRKWGNGDPNNLSPEQEASAAAEINRVLRRRR